MFCWRLGRRRLVVTWRGFPEPAGGFRGGPRLAEPVYRKDRDGTDFAGAIVFLYLDGSDHTLRHNLMIDDECTIW